MKIRIARHGRRVIGTLAAAFAAAALPASAASAQPGPLRPGAAFSEAALPGGCESEAGALVEGKPARAVLQIRCGTSRYAVLARETGRDPKGSPRWQALDVVDMPAPARDVTVNDTDCRGPAPGYVLSVAEWQRTKSRTYASRIHFAAWVGPGSAQFERLDPRRVVCEYTDDRD